MKKFLVFALASILLFAIGCTSDDPSGEIVGAWKATNAKSLSGKPLTILLEKNRISIGASSADVSFSKKDGKILIARAGESNPIYVATVIDKDTVKFSNHVYGENTFVRITRAELEGIEAAPSKLQSKQDPF